MSTFWGKHHSHSLHVAVLQAAERFLLPSGEISGILEPDVPAPLQLGTALLFLTPNVVHRLVQQREEMELVKGDLGRKELGLDPDDAGGRQIAGYLGGLGRLVFVRLQIQLQGLHRAGVLPLRRKEHLGLRQVHKQAHIVMTSAAGRLIHANLADGRPQTGPNDLCLLTQGRASVDRGQDIYEQQYQQHVLKNLHRRVRDLG